MISSDLRLSYSESLVISFVVLLALPGLYSFDIYNRAPANALFEFVFLLFSVFLASGIWHKALLPLCIFTIYWTTALVIAVFIRDAHPLDFFLAYKPFVYLSVLCLFIKKRFFPEQLFGRLLFVLLVLMLLKYGLARFFFAMPRPGLFTENNFELMLPLLLFIFLADLNAWRVSWFYVVALLCLFVLSGSRSGIASLMFVLMIFSYRHLDLRTFGYLVAGFASLLAAMVVLQDRLAGTTLESIDRVRFLLLFVESIQDWSFWHYIFGTAPITPLDPWVCEELAYYQTLFSFSGSGACYSVILHGAVLRLLFDHGVAGGLGIFLFIAWALRSCGYRWKTVTAVLGVLFLNGLSVSSVYSIYAIFPIALALAVNRGVIVSLSVLATGKKGELPGV